jgi:hypothetical protein
MDDLARRAIQRAVAALNAHGREAVDVFVAELSKPANKDAIAWIQHVAIRMAARWSNRE